ncbi:MAG: ExbD/TolR family protein [Aquificaceae bacterium]
MEDKEFKDINVIPLVDIMLVLLTIVLITATFVVQGSLPVNLPTAKSQEVKELKGIEIIIKRDGTVEIEGRQMNSKDVEGFMSGMDRNAVCNVLADRDAKVQSLVNILDILKRLGFSKVSIRTQME